MSLIIFQMVRANIFKIIENQLNSIQFETYQIKSYFKPRLISVRLSIYVFYCDIIFLKNVCSCNVCVLINGEMINSLLHFTTVECTYLIRLNLSL